MKVYVVIQKDEPDTRVRGVFSTHQKAQEYIGPQNVKPFIRCKDCGQKTPNPAYSTYEEWKDKLFVREWEVQ